MMVLGLAGSLPAHLFGGLTAAGVPAARARAISRLPPVGTLFAAFLGYNPVAVLLGPTLHHLPAASARHLTGRAFFPSLIAAPFEQGLSKAFDFAAGACLVAAVASWLSGERAAPEAEEVPVEAAGTTGSSRVTLEPAVEEVTGGTRPDVAGAGAGGRRTVAGALRQDGAGE